MSVLESARLSGNRPQKCKLFGFDGLKCGPIFYGRSHQGVMIRLSGHVAALEWMDFFPLLSNVSRIDCAVTVRTDRESSGLSYMHWQEALAYQKKTAPKFRVVHIDGGKHGSTLVMGSRASESYGRIYDKFLESNQEEYRDCWRYEVEFKRAEALSVAHRLALEPQDLSVPMGIVYEWFRKRRVFPTWEAQVITRSRIGRGVTEVERQLTWLSSQVGPTVRRLLDQGYEKQVHRALFNPDRMQPTRLDDAVYRARVSRGEGGER